MCNILTKSDPPPPVRTNLGATLQQIIDHPWYNGPGVAEGAAAAEGAAVGGGVGFIEAAWVPILGELVAAGLRPEGVRGFDVNVTEEGAERQRGATSNKAGAASALEKKSATLPTLDLFGEVRGEGRPLACPPCSRLPRGDAAAEEEPPLTCAAARPHSCTWE